MMLELIRSHVPTGTDLRLAVSRGPYRPGNWHVDWLNTPAEDFGAVRDVTDEMQAKRHWIMVADGHALDGQVYGREEAW